MVKTGDDKSESVQNRERIEWVAAAVSGVVVLALAGFILFEALTKTSTEPIIDFELGQVFAMGNGFGVEVTVRNDGHQTISEVEFEAVSPTGETGSATLDYLPAESESKVGFGFDQEVDPERLTLRVLGYTYP